LPAIAGLTGLACSVPTSPRAQVVAGSTRLHDALDVPAATGDLHVRLERDAQAFFQGNRYLLARLLAGVADVVPAGRVLDLYAGVGPFAMTLAARGDADIEAVEGDPHAAADLGRNAARADGRLIPRHYPVESFLSRPTAAAVDTVIVDPPRTGLSREAVTGVTALGSPRLVYVSCDAATAARDARALLDSGYELTRLRAFDMFPNTSHIETLMLFER
jgi:23S rRNA (uracil1939-C5)-methyltransferase